MIWFTDRSRYETGTGHCRRARYLEYHAGPSGYGIRRKAESIPLARGIYVHRALESLLTAIQQIIADTGEVTIPDWVVRTAIAEATDSYKLVIDTRGLHQVAEPETLQHTIGEQCALIEGLTWVVALDFLPWLLSEYELVEAEHDGYVVYDCTCGLGDGVGDGPTHDARGCDGIGWQCRPDLILRHRLTGRYAMMDFKTCSQAGERFETQFETSIQFSASVLEVEHRLGIDIAETFVLGLLVGSRWSKEPPARQNSVLCYGYRQPGIPPLGEARWEAVYDDPARIPQRLPRSFQKAPVWLESSFPEAAQHGMSPSEYWVKQLPPEVRKQQLLIVGPLQKQRVLLDGFTRELVAEERRWQQTLWTIHDAASQSAWASPAVQEVLDREVPRSWQCRRYGKAHQCAFVPVCHQHEGWDDPLGRQGFTLRAPHHSGETAQMGSRGVDLPDDLEQQGADAGDD